CSSHHEKGTTVTNTEHSPKARHNTGFFATLRALLSSQGTGAPAPSSAVNRVSPQTAAGKLTDLGSSKRVLRSNNTTNRRSPRRLLRSLTLAPLLVFVSVLAFSAT